MLRPLPWALLAFSLSVNVLLAWGGRPLPGAEGVAPLEHRWAAQARDADRGECAARADALEARLAAAERELDERRPRIEQVSMPR